MPTQPEEPDPFIGQVLNSYRLEKELGGGGMATVYRASHILSLQEVSRPEITVSRQYAEITLEAEGFVVRDLGSFNGTQVNETKLEKGEPHRLTKGDHLCLGKVMLVVEEVS
jgi:hypothetical protein